MHVLDHFVHIKFQSSTVVHTEIKIIFKPRACSQKWIGLVKCTYYYQLKLNSGENKKIVTGTVSAVLNQKARESSVRTITS